MPSNSSPLGALPRLFRRPRLLIVGCGDVGQRVARRVNARVLALSSSPGRLSALRAQGIVPLLGNLDEARTLRRLSGLGQRVLHLAPPPGPSAGRPDGDADDPRTRALLRALRLRSAPLALVYGSTSGVYGDLQGAVATETVAPRAANMRARRRLDAEGSVRWLGRSAGVRSSILRIPGIYALDREGGNPRERLLRGTPVLRSEDDVFTNHIHAEDLARACIAALYRGRAQRVFNVNDNTRLRMGDYFDTAADLFGLPRPPRISRAEATQQLPPMLLSFMSESRQMDNTRMKRELRVRLKFGTVGDGLKA